MKKVIKNHTDSYRTKEVFIPFGGDFAFINASKDLDSIDRMIAYMNQHHGHMYEFKYSTPNDYLATIKRMNVDWPMKYDDLFPYSDYVNQFWTGFYTSRPNLKM